MTEKIKWCIDNHTNTNHFYDEYLPYKFHLDMTNNVAQDFFYLLPKRMFVDESSFLTKGDVTKTVITLAAYGHDNIEDCRISYNTLLRVLGKDVAEIVRAVTNYSRGRNRDERMLDYCYEDIRNTKGATFIKMADRIANVQYSKLTKSRMFEMYKKENENFMYKVGAAEYPEMKQYLINLFNN